MKLTPEEMKALKMPLKELREIEVREKYRNDEVESLIEEDE
jgi:hypothetical protein